MPDFLMASGQASGGHVAASAIRVISIADNEDTEPVHEIVLHDPTLSQLYKQGYLYSDPLVIRTR